MVALNFLICQKRIGSLSLCKVKHRYTAIEEEMLPESLIGRENGCILMQCASVVFFFILQIETHHCCYTSFTSVFHLCCMRPRRDVVMCTFLCQ
ncbi:hypothetical protein V6N13_016544 [Hibiscus sabdariffa]